MVTITDVAKKAEVSISTVSRVLGAGESPIRISEATRQRIHAAVRELEYTPHALASGLRSRHSRMIGVIIQDATMAFPAKAISAIGAPLTERGYNFLLAQAGTSSDVHWFMRAYERYRVSGVIFVVPVPEVFGEPFLSEYVRKLRHVVGLGCWPGPPNMVCVGIDNRLGVDLALDHLVGLGHHRIAFVGTTRGWDQMRRLDAYSAYVESRGILNRPAYVVQQDELATPAVGAAAMARLLDLPDPPSAVLFANDEMAIAGIGVAQQRGHSVPGDIAVVGFDDIPWASFCWPPLTTVRQPIQSMVERATSVLFELIDGKTVDPTDHSLLFTPELVVRGSTQANDDAPRAIPTSGRPESDQISSRATTRRCG